MALLEETMKPRILGAIIGLVIAFALPTYAQQKDLADPQTTQKILALIEALNEAQNNNDAAAIAAFFTRDGVFVTLEGSIIGRQAIQKWFTDVYQWWHPKNSIHKVDGNVVHSIGTTGNELWATGEWSETGQGKTGEPIPIKGYWFFIFVREADDWKVRVTGGNATLDSVILINKSFAPQPAATPSPTASPGTLQTYAQQRGVADPQTTQKLLAGVKAHEEARNNNDPGARRRLHARRGFSYAIRANHRSGSHSEMVYRLVPIPESPQKLDHQGGRECLSLDRYSWQRTVGNRRME
jgi:uncharacterized protein (TIGR02246 family)